MDSAMILFKQLLQMMIYIAIGFALYRAKLVTKEGSKALSHLLLYVVLPCAIANSFRIERTAQAVTEIGLSLLFALIALVIAVVISQLFFRKRPIDSFGASFSNAGFMGIPLITAVLGSSSVCYIAGLVAMLNTMQWTYGQWLLTGDKNKMSPKAILTSPIVLAFIAGLILFFTQLPLPSIVGNSISAIAACNGPVAMIILGVLLGQCNLKDIFTDKFAYLNSLVRLVIIPLATLLAFWLIPAQWSAIRMALFLAACAPVGSNVAVYAQKLDMDPSYASCTVCLSTLFSVVTMPVMMMLAQMIW